MAEQFTEYICVACGGPLHFDGASGKMKCDYCDSEYALEEVKAYYAEENKKNSTQDESLGAESSWGETLDSMRAYSCQSCGAELICDDTTAATSCPYCGNVAIMPQQFKGIMRPKYVIPFKMDKSEAKSKLEAYCKGKKLLPNSFTQDNHIDEIKGIYVPFWLYSGTVDADVKYDAEKDDVKKTPIEKITTTKYYDIERRGGVSFKMIPTDASSAMPDDLMDSIEPYDYSGMKDFEMEYLAGFLADKYDVSKEESRDRARNRAENSTLEMIRDTVDNYDRVFEREAERKVHFLGEKQDYAMCPVWLLNTKWNDENFLFAINGQTGKMTGNLPIDKKKQWLRIMIFALPLFLIGYFFFGSTVASSIVFGLIIAILGGFIVNCVNVSSMKPVAERRDASDYVKSANNDEEIVKLSVKEDRYVKTTTKREMLNK